ncbi:MAG TPA: hypothetical protein VNX28_11615 [Gemmataceae bacterium]|jgi:hypothetical protein|nr:hypothetical protein [Gemmataceae bacterium]
MSVETEFMDLFNGRPKDPSRPARDKREETDEESCPAFGYLRGLQDRALAIEFRLRNGDREWYPYSWLGPWRYNPSVGLLLKFTGDIVTLVLIRGSNLDVHVNDTGVNLTDRGLQRHRILWTREMDEDELHLVGEGMPTIDRIDIAEFESDKEAKEYLKKTAPAFCR